jgi:hypothetical protein
LSHPTTSFITFDSKQFNLQKKVWQGVLIILSTFAATIMKIGYGIAIQESDYPYISIAEEVLSGVAEAGIPGSFLVDLFPILKYVPSWFPGAVFQRKAACWREAIKIMADKPFHHVEEQLVQVNLFESSLASFNNDSTEKW